jgi:hypothetical protein
VRYTALLPTVVLVAMSPLITGQAPAAAPTPVYAGLPNVTGYTADQVKNIVGPPVVARTSKTGVATWLYATPDGDRYVYFVNGVASMTAPTKQRTPAPAPVAGCSQAPEARVVTTLVANTPAYSAPRVRPEAVVRMAAGTTLTVLRTAGAWFAVSLGETHGAYVHCSDVRVTQ